MGSLDTFESFGLEGLESSFSDLKKYVNIFRDGLFRLINLIPSEQVVKFINSLGGIEYDEGDLTIGGNINVNLRVKDYALIIKFPVSKDIVNKYDEGKKGRDPIDHAILGYYDCFINNPNLEGVEDRIVPSEYGKFMSLLSTFRGYIENFLTCFYKNIGDESLKGVDDKFLPSGISVAENGYSFGNLNNGYNVHFYRNEHKHYGLPLTEVLTQDYSDPYRDTRPS